jgi:antitoxin HicB
MDYPVTLERDDKDTILVSFPDLPAAHTFGEDESDALERAKDALATVIDGLHQGPARHSVAVGFGRVSSCHDAALVEAKVRLYETMRAAKVNKSELAHRRHSIQFPGLGRFRPITWEEWFENFFRHELVFVFEELDAAIVAQRALLKA